MDGALENTRPGADVIVVEFITLVLHSGSHNFSATCVIVVELIALALQSGSHHFSAMWGKHALVILALHRLH